MRSFEFLQIPERPAKPRVLGRTSVADVGWPNSYAAGILELWADSIDVVKISAFTMTADDKALREKIAIYNSYGIDTQAGGPLLEVARLQGKERQTIERIKEMGFHSIEISAEALPRGNSYEDDERLANLAREFDLGMHGEVGKKFPEGDRIRRSETQLDVEAAVADVMQYLSIGCSFVYFEGHLLRQIIGDNAQHAAERGDTIEELGRRIGLDRLFFEVPFTYLSYSSKRILQHWLVRTFGPGVNIANVLINEVPEVEVVRTGMFPVFGAEGGDHPFILAAADSPGGVPADGWWRR